LFRSILHQIADIGYGVDGGEARLEIRYRPKYYKIPYKLRRRKYNYTKYGSTKYESAE